MLIYLIIGIVIGLGAGLALAESTFAQLPGVLRTGSSIVVGIVTAALWPIILVVVDIVLIWNLILELRTKKNFDIDTSKISQVFPLPDASAKTIVLTEDPSAKVKEERVRVIESSKPVEWEEI